MNRNDSYLRSYWHWNTNKTFYELLMVYQTFTRSWENIHRMKNDNWYKNYNQLLIICNIGDGLLYVFDNRKAEYLRRNIRKKKKISTENKKGETWSENAMKHQNNTYFLKFNSMKLLTCASSTLRNHSTVRLTHVLKLLRWRNIDPVTRTIIRRINTYNITFFREPTNEKKF